MAMSVHFLLLYKCNLYKNDIKLSTNENIHKQNGGILQWGALANRDPTLKVTETTMYVYFLLLY